ncbi:TetR/AcrR family transcriptional regulator [uncultured Pontibacter sp.]|uniref:TetR/AcrR family transcriptional regulator n=1 Tax=uncultured Pontibacter sp. TaxID=453356 RepID=UPI002604E5EC|nr:TetR/AcrR family transcriptional regulator [uncultured Pontibacter sp.]
MLAVSDRQLEIIESAGRILNASGVSGLTIKNLAKEMQFSESAIYRHFASKEEIILVLLNYLSESMDERLGRAVQDIHDPEEKFKALFRNQFEFFRLHPHFVVAVFSDGLLEESQLINNAILKIMQVKMKHLLPVMMEGQQRGVFTNAITTEELMHIVMGSFRLQMFKWRIANFEFDIARSGENLIQSLLTLIRVK